MPEPPEQDPAPRKAHFGFKANPMDKLFISHGGLSSLCFDRNAFFDDAFDVDGFLSSHTQRGIPLEVLKEDLATYRKIVQSALVQLVDREYADFVHLSSSLVGVDKGIEKLQNPIENHLRHVESCLSVLHGHIHLVDTKILRKTTIQGQKHHLRCLISAMGCMETLVGVIRVLQETTGSSGRVPLLFRVSDLLVRIYAEELEIGQTTWYSSIKSQLSFVDASFTKILGEELLLSVRSGEARNIQIYCLVYRHLNRTTNAYQVVSDGAIRPALSAVIRDSQLKKASLEVLLSDVFAVIEERFYSLAYVSQADFILESVWPSLIGLLSTEIQAYLAPDQADLFRRNYSAAKSFMNKFAHLFTAVRKDFTTKFWKHSATGSFLDKWSFSVYYQVRFLEIASPVEDAIRRGVGNGPVAAGLFRLDVTWVSWAAIERCWHSDVCLAELVHRFWKLSLLLVARYISCLEQFQQEAGSVVSLPAVLSDLALFRSLISELPDKYVRPVLEEDGKSFDAVNSVLSDSLKESVQILQGLEDRFVIQLASSAAVEASAIIKSVQDAPRLYRRTNREAPVAAAPYVDATFELLTRKLSQDVKLPSDQLKTAYQSALNEILSQFATLALDLLDSVRRMEDSLKKLRKTRFAADASAGLTDDDKIRLQLSLDVIRIQHWIGQLGFSVSDFPIFLPAKERILSEKPDQDS